MALTSSRQVSSGYFRVHLYVLLGLHALAGAVAWLEPQRFDLWPPIAGAALSYVGSIVWLYEGRRVGKVLLTAVAGVSLAGAWLALEEPARALLLGWLAPVGGGLVLGVTMAAMLLGHWYLNTPGMKIAPLQRLVSLMALSVVFRAVLAGCGLSTLLYQVGSPEMAEWLFLCLRWLAGLVAPLILAWMTWQTLKIPNTQSATGILYVGVIVTFIGELTAQLISADLGIPL